jgi:hypothetical protein
MVNSSIMSKIKSAVDTKSTANKRYAFRGVFSEFSIVFGIKVWNKKKEETFFLLIYFFSF